MAKKKEKKASAKTKKKKVLVKTKKNIKAKKIAKKKPVKAKKILAKKKITKKIAKKKVKKIVQKKKPKNHTKVKKTRVEKKLTHEIQAFPAEALFKARIKVVGIGGGGGSIVSEIGRSLQKATFVVADTDMRAMKKRPGIKYVLFGQEMTHGLGTGLNIDLAKKAAEQAKEKVSSIFKDQDIVIFIASLGGGLGSGATQVFAEAAKEYGAITLGIFTLPFKFEGANKYKIAQNALKNLKSSLNVSLVIPNEKIFKVIDSNTAITEAFSTVNKSLIESLESLIDLIYNPGVINIDFADLRSILKGIGNTAFINTVEESGKNRAEKICEGILQNSLLQSSAFEVEKILLNIAGADNLSMLEVEKISRYVAEHHPNTKTIFGISKNQKLKNKIKTTILMTGGGVKEREFTKLLKEEKQKLPENVKIEKEAENKAVPVLENTKKSNKVEKKEEKKEKPIINEKPKVKPKKKAKKVSKPKIEKNPVTFVPIFNKPVAEVPIVDERKINIVNVAPDLGKATIRRSALEIKKAEELEEKKRQDQEKEWEIPAFLRKIKYKS